MGTGINRNKDLDNLKCILMYFVVLQHTLYFLNGWGYYTSGLVQDNYIGEYLRCIQMPAFMLISGFFFKKTVSKNKNCTEVISDNILIGTIMPIFSWGIFAYLIECIGKYSFENFLIFIWDKFWFFKVLMLLKLTFLVKHYVLKTRVFVIVLVICFVFMPLKCDNVFLNYSAMFPFFLIGYNISETKMENILLNKKMEVKKIIICGVVWCIIFILNYS